MKKSFILTIAFIALVALWLLSLGLFLHLSQYDPYSWWVPGEESVLSRRLWLERRALYLRMGVISFVAACVLGLLQVLIRHRRSGTPSQDEANAGGG